MICSGGLLDMLIASCAVRSQPTYLCKPLQSSRYWSTSGPPAPSVSLFRPRCSPALTRSLNELLGLHPELEAGIQATVTGQLTFLTTAYGRPYTVAGFGNAMREWCVRSSKSAPISSRNSHAAGVQFYGLFYKQFQLMVVGSGTKGWSRAALKAVIA